MNKSKVSKRDRIVKQTLYFLERQGVKPLENQMSLFDNLPNTRHIPSVPIKLKEQKEYEKPDSEKSD